MFIVHDKTIFLAARSDKINFNLFLFKEVLNNCNALMLGKLGLLKGIKTLRCFI